MSVPPELLQGLTLQLVGTVVQGPRGPQGKDGTPGTNGIDGAKGDKGEKGDTGAKGDTGSTGPANVLLIGTVVEGTAAATITGTAPAQALNLSIPRGPQGLQGLKGDTGAEGPRGIQGAQGIQGVQGIQGPKGDTGLQGIQGPKGDTGSQGIQGVAGLHGWTPKFAAVTDGTRRVQQVVDWFGGTGSKPATGEYVGATGLVATITQAVDIRGPAGAGTGSVNPTGSIAANDLAAFADASGQVIKALKAADLPVSTAAQTALNGKAPLTGVGASGTWPVSISGSATSPTLTGYLIGYTLNDTNAGVAGGYTVRYVLPSAANKPPGVDGNLQTIAHSETWATQIYSDWRTNEWYVRAQNNGVWTVWRNLLHSGNFGTYAPSLTGTGASGNWDINTATATKLATARSINGIAFDGSANISVPVDWSAVTGKPAVIASGENKALAREAIEAVSVAEVITPFVLVSATTQLAVAGVQYGLSNAAVTTLTLPASPSIETLVWVVVLNNRNNNVLARNGSLIGGLAEDMTIDNPKRPFAVKFIGGVIGWVIL